MDEVIRKLSTEAFDWNYRIEGSDDPYSETVNVYAEEKELGGALEAYTRCPYKHRAMVRVVSVSTSDVTFAKDGGH